MLYLLNGFGQVPHDQLILLGLGNHDNIFHRPDDFHSLTVDTVDGLMDCEIPVTNHDSWLVSEDQEGLEPLVFVFEGMN